MILPTLTDLTDPTVTDGEVAALQAAVMTAIAEREARRDTAEWTLKTDISATISALDKLIGPASPTVKSAQSLTEANLYTAPELAAATGIAHDAELAWMLTIARTVRNLARVVSGTID